LIPRCLLFLYTLYNSGQVFPGELVWTFNKYVFFRKRSIISVFWKVNFVASFGINTVAAGIAYELNALVCNQFNQVCQLFSINMASVFILVNLILFMIVFHTGKRFFTCPFFYLTLPTLGLPKLNPSSNPNPNTTIACKTLHILVIFFHAWQKCMPKL
jgi:hypothetical protein